MDPTTARMFAERRERFLARMEKGVAVVATAPMRVRSNDVEYKYRPDSDFHYLTGFCEPSAVAVLCKDHGTHRFVLFVLPRDKEKETWTGYRAGEEGAVARFGAEAAFPIDELPAKLKEFLANAERLYFRFGRDPRIDETVLATIQALAVQGRAGIHPPHTIVDPSVFLHEMRLIKSADDLACMRRAAGISAEAHREAMRAVYPGMYEYEVEAVLEYHFKRHGSPYPAYPSIVGSGPNATILHYTQNDRRMESGDLVLVDAGCEIEMYAADITRTYPVNGRFTRAQRAVYELVLAAQKEAIARVAPGATFQSVHDRAVEVLTQGLVDLGLLAGGVKDLIETSAYKKFYMHRTGHWLGIDVHDVGRYKTGDQSRVLEPGMVATVEPGLYFGPDEPGIPEDFRGIGVRIEDDVLVTTEGRDVLTAECPKEPADLEREVGAGRLVR
jgi:Xaa-Pro aminopeptidase